MLIVHAQAAAPLLLAFLRRRQSAAPIDKEKGTQRIYAARPPGHPSPRADGGGGGPLWRAYAVLDDGSEWLVPGVSRDPETVRTAALADRSFERVPVDARVERCPACCECRGAAAIYGDFCGSCTPDE